MLLGSLESTQGARVMLMLRAGKMRNSDLHIFRALQTSRVHPELDIRTLSMKKLLILVQVITHISNTLDILMASFLM